MNTLKLLFSCAISANLLLFHASAYSIPVPANVSTEWLKTNIDDKQLVIVEMSDIAEYEFNGHIPGSVYTNKGFWRYADSDGSLVHLATNQLQQRIRGLGISNDNGIVIYYKGNEINDVLGAYYLFWLFHRLGHTNVGMLDQGWHGWLLNKGEIEETGTQIKTGSFVAHPLPALEISSKELNTVREHYTLIDGRPKTHFDGSTKFSANPKYGRIPGSVSQPWSDYINQDSDGRYYVTTPKLPAVFSRNSILLNRPLLLTCLGGTGAAINYVVFYISGYHNMRLDDAGLRRWNTLQLPLIKTDRNNPTR